MWISNARGEVRPLCTWLNECGEGERRRKEYMCRAEVEEDEG